MPADSNKMTATTRISIERDGAEPPLAAASFAFSFLLSNFTFVIFFSVSLGSSDWLGYYGNPLMDFPSEIEREARLGPIRLQDLPGFDNVVSVLE